MIDPFALPNEITVGARRRGNEYGWTPETFPTALARAAEIGYACQGGQFQFRIEDSICEMYWLQTVWCEKYPVETWSEFVHRSCNTTLNDFRRLLDAADFQTEAASFEFLRPLLNSGWEPMADLVFVAYFEPEVEVLLETQHCGEGKA